MGSRERPGGRLRHRRAAGRDRLRSARSGTQGRARVSASPLLGQSAIARSAWAVIVSDGLTPRLAVMADPSATCRPGWP